MTSFIEKVAEAMIAAGMKVNLVHSAPQKRFDVITLTPYFGAPVKADQAIIGDIQRVNVNVLGKEYKTGYNVIWEAYNFLNNSMKTGIVYEGYSITDFVQSPVFIGNEDKGGSVFVFNFIATNLLKE